MSGHHPHEETTTSPYAARIRAIEGLLLEKGILTEPEVQDRISYMEARSPPTARSSSPVPGSTTNSKDYYSPTVRPQPRSSEWTPSIPPSSSSRTRRRYTT